MEEEGSLMSKKDAALLNLVKAEENIFKVLSIAQDTTEELKKVPGSDLNKINELSLAYIENIKDLRKNLLSTSDALFSTNDDDSTVSMFFNILLHEML
jgi:hypothetical protein